MRGGGVLYARRGGVLYARRGGSSMRDWGGGLADMPTSGNKSTHLERASLPAAVPGC